MRTSQLDQVVRQGFKKNIEEVNCLDTIDEFFDVVC